MDRFIPDPAMRPTPPSPGRWIRRLQQVALGVVGVSVLIGVGAVALTLGNQALVPDADHRTSGFADSASQAATADALTTASIAPLGAAGAQTPPAVFSKAQRNSKSDRLHVQWNQKGAALRERLEPSTPVVVVRQDVAQTTPRALPALKAPSLKAAIAPVQQPRRPAQRLAATEPDPEPRGTGVAEPAAAKQDDTAAPGEAMARALGEAAGVAEPEQLPEPEPAAVNHRTAPVLDDVNMRSGPDNGAAVITVVPNGTQVEVIECDYWCEVKYSGKRGWIYKSFIRGAS